MKRMCVTPWMTVDVGGQYRVRLHDERHMRNEPTTDLGIPGPPRPVLGLSNADDDFVLHRTRLYVNTEIGQRLRVYAEMLDAVGQYEDYTPRPIEENRLELQNLFIDVVAIQGASGDLTARVGRQEIALGSQRLVSPLDWANTRRTFEGARLLSKGENWDVDGLWVRPMRRIVEDLDPPDLTRQLYGVYSTYKGLVHDKLDLYWLAYDDSLVGFRYDTVAARFYGGRKAWLYEAEGGFQFGTNPDNSDHSAGFFTLGLGHKFSDVAWTPTIWAYYDWASGDNTVGNGFNHYEPLAHKYLGFMDFFGRRNIETPNLQLTLQPHKKLQLLVWYYYFRLQNGNDVPYSVVMTPYAGLTSGTGVRDLGHEIDLTATWSMTARTDLLLGYSHFFAGDFYDSVPFAAALPNNADFFYTQFTVNF
ncbi:MAG: alginate export family protein [Planctomycetes bacterium]|nr:alginate export family protein [Planctomycetota bacterium]